MRSKIKIDLKSISKSKESVNPLEAVLKNSPIKYITCVNITEFVALSFEDRGSFCSVLTLSSAIYEYCRILFYSSRYVVYVSGDECSKPDSIRYMVL